MRTTILSMQPLERSYWLLAAQRRTFHLWCRRIAPRVRVLLPQPIRSPARSMPQKHFMNIMALPMAAAATATGSMEDWYDENYFEAHKAQEVQRHRPRKSQL